MKFAVWGKEKITQLSDLEKDMWFDVLNNGLEEDRDISSLIYRFFASLCVLCVLCGEKNFSTKMINKL